MTELSPGAQPEEDDAILVNIDEFGIFVQGQQDIVERGIDRLLGEADVAPTSRMRLTLSDLAAVGATGAALAATSGEYLRLTADSLAKVGALGAQFDASGALRGYVLDGGKFAGQLTFEPVSLVAEQALALQTAAVSLALRSAIANVQKAVERVEGKVDKINRHLDSRLRGDIIGTYRHLAAVVAATQDRGHLLDVDWDSVSGTRALTARDLDTLRAFVRTKAGEVTRELNVPDRRARFRQFNDETGNVRDLLELILVAEQSVHLYEYLRLQQVRQREPEHISSALADARASLVAQHVLDEELVEALVAAVERGRGIDPLEIHRVLSKNGLDKQVTIFHGLIREFASATRSTPPQELTAIGDPTLADARDAALTRTVEAAQVARALGGVASREGSAIIRTGGDRIGRAVSARVPRRTKSNAMETSPDKPAASAEPEA